GHSWPTDEHLANRVSELQRDRRSVRESARVLIQFGQPQHVLQDGLIQCFAATNLDVECPGRFLPRISLESRCEAPRKQVGRTVALNQYGAAQCLAFDSRSSTARTGTSPSGRVMPPPRPARSLPRRATSSGRTRLDNLPAQVATTTSV